MLEALTDVWSQIRKQTAKRLYGVLDLFPLRSPPCSSVASVGHVISVEGIFARLCVGCLTGKVIEKDGHKERSDSSFTSTDLPALSPVCDDDGGAWRAREGCLLAIAAVIKKFKRILKAVSEIATDMP